MSLFYASSFEHLFPVPLIVFERLAGLQHLLPEVALAQTMSECCNKPAPTEAEVLYFVDRLQTQTESATDKTEARPEPKFKVRSLGTAFQDFLKQLDVSRILLMACNYDYEKARHLYTRVDYTVANQVVEDFLRLQNERNHILYESVLYGFGGKYKEETEEYFDSDGMDAATAMRMLLS